MEQIKCSKCGIINDSASKFCVQCGNELKPQKLSHEEYKFLYESKSGIATFFTALAWLFCIAIFLFVVLLFWLPIIGCIGIASCAILCVMFAALSEHFKKLNDISNTLLRIEKRLK